VVNAHRFLGRGRILFPLALPAAAKRALNVSRSPRLGPLRPDAYDAIDFNRLKRVFATCLPLLLAARRGIPWNLPQLLGQGV
jgi:hypothetical protein